MMRRITDPSRDERRMLETVQKVREQLDRLTPLDITNDAFRKILNPAAASLKSAPLTEAQLRLAAKYLRSLSAREQVSMQLRNQRQTSEQIAKTLKVSVEWVRLTNAQHIAKIFSLLYPP
jgi:hypothetical protein